jgi:hypothetical protein
VISRWLAIRVSHGVGNPDYEDKNMSIEGVPMPKKGGITGDHPDHSVGFWFAKRSKIAK